MLIYKFLGLNGDIVDMWNTVHTQWRWKTDVAKG
jgi:hypothetical protein